MSTYTIYHNPRCSKSRKALELLKERGVDIEIVEYLKTPLDAKQLRDLHARLGLDAHAMVRTKKPEYAESGLSANSTAEEIFVAIAKTPSCWNDPL